jgi:transcriptional regulator with XRE-family HTH domain
MSASASGCAVLNMSQTDLGVTSGITFQQIQKYEKGTNRVSASRLQEFSKLLDVPVSFFFQGLASSDTWQRNAPDDSVQQLRSTPNGIDLTKAFISIENKSLRRSIGAIVEGIAKQEAAPGRPRQ